MGRPHYKKDKRTEPTELQKELLKYERELQPISPDDTIRKQQIPSDKPSGKLAKPNVIKRMRPKRKDLRTEYRHDRGAEPIL